MNAHSTPPTPPAELDTRETLLALKMLINTAHRRTLTREEAKAAMDAIDGELNLNGGRKEVGK